MKNRRKIYFWFVTLVISLPLLAFSFVRYIESNNQSLPFYGENVNEKSAEEAKKVNSFQFTNQDGNTLDGKFVEGKVWVACYFFTTCSTICPKMIAGMGDIQRNFSNEDRLRMVAFTVDPVNDTPEVLKEYATTRNINTKQWSLLTGNKKELYRYARKELALLATDGDGGPQDFIHSDRLVLIDQNNFIRGYYDGTEPAEVKQLIIDIKKLLKRLR
jgi:protein SCO1/2